MTHGFGRKRALEHEWRRAPPLRCTGNRLQCTTMLRQPASATNTTISYFFSYYRGFPSGATVVFARARLP